MGFEAGGAAVEGLQKEREPNANASGSRANEIWQRVSCYGATRLCQATL